MHGLLYYTYIFLLPILNTHVYKPGTCDLFVTHKIKLLPYDITIYIIFSCVLNNTFLINFTLLTYLLTICYVTIVIICCLRISMLWSHLCRYIFTFNE